MKPLSIACTATAVFVLVALFLAPQTRWLVRQQVLMSLGQYHPFPGSDNQPHTRSFEDDQRQIQAVLARRPDDFGLAYSQAIGAENSQAIGAENSTLVTALLRPLERRFPNRPVLYAGILRRAVVGLHWNRFEETRLDDLPQPASPPHLFPNAPETLAAYDHDAVMGERLDPNNAYFPIMRAIGLFAAGRDRDAQAAVERAAHESGWREYVPEEVEARWRLHQDAFGDPGALSRSTVVFTTIFPQYIKMRSLARLLLYQAMQEERAGHFEEGLKRRAALRHYGELMRVHSTSLIGSLVGIAIIRIALADRGGVKPPKPPPGLTWEQHQRLRLDAWSAYVTRGGHPELAAQAQADEEASRQVRAVTGNDRVGNLIGALLRLTGWWLAGLAALANSGWLLLFGALAAVLGRGRRVRESKPLPPGAAWGIGAALCLSAVSTALVVMDPPERVPENLLYYIAEFVLIPGGLLLIVAVLRPRLRRPLVVGTLVCWGALVVFSGLGFLLVRQSHGFDELLSAANGLNSTSQEISYDTPGRFDDRWQGAISAALTVVVPLLLLLYSSLVARVHRVPVSVGIIRGFRALALPTSCLLLMIWGGLLLGTVRQEHVVNQGLWHNVHEEGPYTAAQANLPWPGPVP
jgi:hypothetical protein